MLKFAAVCPGRVSVLPSCCQQASVLAQTPGREVRGCLCVTHGQKVADLNVVHQFGGGASHLDLSDLSHGEGPHSACKFVTAQPVQFK